MFLRKVVRIHEGLDSILYEDLRINKELPHNTELSTTVSKWFESKKAEPYTKANMPICSSGERKQYWNTSTE